MCVYEREREKQRVKERDQEAMKRKGNNYTRKFQNLYEGLTIKVTTYTDQGHHAPVL